ncbi:hypothetical protein PS685_05174 [Pseudomonas fluorescens]|uniref:Uncharacterized protein n=1 Tax=Pseudomonas fluorescens TaxID=294 RepID=A0A5E7A3N1_PSEFL|nr:hypothetical protein PS685_05174 [Pseudomonas fluorescens]
MFFSIDQLLLGAGLKAFGLLVLVMAVDTGLQAALAQVQHFTGAFQVIPGQVAHDKGMSQAAIPPRYIGSQGQARGLSVDFGSAGLAQRRFPGRTLAAP